LYIILYLLRLQDNGYRPWYRKGVGDSICVLGCESDMSRQEQADKRGNGRND